MVIVKNNGSEKIEDFNWECWSYSLNPGETIKMPMTAAKGLQRRRPEVEIIGLVGDQSALQAEPQTETQPEIKEEPSEFTEAEIKEAEAAVASGADLAPTEPTAPENDKRPVSRSEMRRLRKK